MPAQRFAPHTVTFDCWQTLIYEDQPPQQGPSHGRVGVLVERTGADPQRIAEAFSAAWTEHQRAWHRREVFGGPEMTRHILNALGVTLSAAQQAELVERLEDELLTHHITAVEGARELLATLRAAGVRTALICDTGFAPGRVVRQLLDRVGLLEHLEVQIFSNEVRVPKPHPRAFRAALEALDVRAEGAVHVGDLRRSDVAGGRAQGMRTIRFRGRHDDAGAGSGRAGVLQCASVGCDPACSQPEADAVVSTYRELADSLRV